MTLNALTTMCGSLSVKLVLSQQWGLQPLVSAGPSPQRIQLRLPHWDQSAIGQEDLLTW